MASKSIAYFVRPTSYRGEPGFHVGSRGSGGFGTSIFTPSREAADWMANAYRAERDGFITTAEREVIIAVALGGDWEWWANHTAEVAA